MNILEKIRLVLAFLTLGLSIWFLVEVLRFRRVLKDVFKGKK